MIDTNKKEINEIDGVIIYYQYKDGRINFSDMNLKLLLRSISKYMSWIRKIHIISNCPLPTWLDLNNKKIDRISCADIMPQEYCLDCDINAIELNIHNTPNLAKQFIYFVPGMYICGGLSKDNLFRNNLPCDYAEETFLSCQDAIKRHILINDILLLNTKHSRKNSHRLYRNKYLSLSDVKAMIKNAYLMIMKRDHFFGFEYSNKPYCFIKTSFNKVWNEYFKELNDYCTNNKNPHMAYDINLIRFYQYITGIFIPYNWKQHVSIESTHTKTTDSNKKICYLSNPIYENALLNDKFSDKCEFEK